MKTYDPSQVSVTVGANILQNWNTVTIARDERDFTFKTGTQGESTRSKNLNKMGTITIAMDASSDDNDNMSVARIAGSLQSCAVIDKSGTTVALMPQGTIEGPPEKELGKESGENEWVVKGDIPEPYHIGGNNE